MVAPQLLHFVVRNITFILTLTGYTVTCYTNNPCHLWLRWTNVEPQKHVNAKVVRGAVAGTWIDQCFVVYTDVEQQEPGDTFTHTFTLEPWPVCETRWFYFWGTVGGVLSPSASAIFSHHRIAPPPPIGLCAAISPTLNAAGSSNCYDYSSAFIPRTNQQLTSVDIRYGRTTAKPQCFIGLLWIFYTDANGKPTTQLTAAIPFTAKTIAVGEFCIHNIPLPPTTLLADTNYAIAYGFHDITQGEWYENNPYINWGRASGPTCGVTPNHIYFRRFDRIKNQPCGPLVTNWTPYPQTDHLYYQFYGTVA